MDSALRKLGNRALLSPHSASYTEGGELRQGVDWATRSVVTALKGGIPDNVYNKDVLPLWKQRFGGSPVGPLLDKPDPGQRLGQPDRAEKPRILRKAGFR